MPPPLPPRKSSLSPCRKFLENAKLQRLQLLLHQMRSPKPGLWISPEFYREVFSPSFQILPSSDHLKFHLSLAGGRKKISTIFDVKEWRAAAAADVFLLSEKDPKLENFSRYSLRELVGPFIKNSITSRILRTQTFIVPHSLSKELKHEVPEKFIIFRTVPCQQQLAPAWETSFIFFPIAAARTFYWNFYCPIIGTQLMVST